MILGSLDIPDALLNASERGELLVFAGAGISQKGEANLPSFKELVGAIGKNSGMRRPANQDYDKYLGELMDCGVDVHECARLEISRGNSQPNLIHSEIFRLFSNSSSVRVVTTNFDKHLSNGAVKVFGQHVPEYIAPALPLGDDFVGIVYVHGAVDGDVQRLVLTDRDFAYAYSSEGWARRFLYDALSRYTVLFVGYGHNDPPMHYVTRGLKRAEGQHYAIVPVGDTEKWKKLGVSPIPYGTKGRSADHSLVLGGVKAWGDFTRMPLMAHKAEIQALLARSPESLNSDEDSYLQHCFAKRQLLPCFFKEKLECCWLSWAEQNGLLDLVFSEIPDESLRYARVVSRWFAWQAIQHVDRSLIIYARSAGNMRQHLWDAIGEALSTNESLYQSARAKWSAQLCIHWHLGYHTAYLELAMGASAKNGDLLTALMILEFLCSPRILHREPWTMFVDGEDQEKSRTEVKLIATDGMYWCKELWTKHLQPNLGSLASRLAEMAANKLGMAYELQAVQSAPNDPFDAVSDSRSAVEPHEQDAEYQEKEFHLLVDIARDSLEYMLTENYNLAGALCERWGSARSPLLVRLAIHGVRIDPRLSADEKLQWAIERNLFSRLCLWNEFSNLAQHAYSEAGPSERSAFLAHVRETTLEKLQNNADDADLYWWREYSLLEYIRSGLKRACPRINGRLVALRRRYPRFSPSDHPDLLHYGYTGDVKTKSPLLAVDLKNMPVKEAVRYLVHFKDTEWGRHERYGLMGVLRQAVESDISWGIAIAKNLSRRKRYPDDIWHAIGPGLRSEDMSHDAMLRVLAFFESPDSQGVPARLGAEFLASAVGVENGELTATDIKRLQRLAFVCLKRARVDDTVDKAPKNWRSEAINLTGGILCEVLLRILYRRHKRERERRSALVPRFAKEFDRMLTGKTVADQAGRVILSSELFNLYLLDSRWMVDNLIPAFDWDRDELCALQVWHGFLRGNGKLNRHYLQCMLPFFRQSVARMNGVLGCEHSSLPGYVASICLHSNSRKARSGLLVEFLRNADEKQKTSFAGSICELVKAMPERKRSTVWRAWLHSYWQDRILGKPVPLLAEEISVMAKWCLLLEADYSDAVSLLSKSKVTGNVGIHCLRKLSRSDLPNAHPRASADYVLYVLENHGDSAIYTTFVETICEVLVQYPEAHSSLHSIVELLAMRGDFRLAEPIDEGIRCHS